MTERIKSWCCKCCKLTHELDTSSNLVAFFQLLLSSNTVWSGKVSLSSWDRSFFNLIFLILLLFLLEQNVVNSEHAAWSSFLFYKMLTMPSWNFISKPEILESVNSVDCTLSKLCGDERNKFMNLLPDGKLIPSLAILLIFGPNYFFISCTYWNSFGGE